MAEFLDLRDTIARHVTSGASIALEGFTRLIPHAAGHEIIRQGIGDLTLIRMTPDVIYDQIIGIGLARKLVFSYAGNPGVGLLRRFRDAIEHRWPRPLEIEEHSHAAMANAYEAGAAGLPCAAFGGSLGAGLEQVTPTIQRVKCPFTAEALACVHALRPDVTVIHAQKADRASDVLIEGIVGIQKEAVLAAKAAIVTVEEVVKDLAAHPNACILPRWTVNAICVVPGGGPPSYAHGYYDRGNPAYLEWDRVSADRDRFRDWMQANVIKATPADFDGRVAGLRASQ